MPKKVAAWACEFGCGGRTNTRRRAIVWHEQTCASNPDRKACRTCHYQGNDEDGFYCTINKTPTGRTLAVNCEFWEAGT